MPITVSYGSFNPGRLQPGEHGRARCQMNHFTGKWCRLQSVSETSAERSTKMLVRKRRENEVWKAFLLDRRITVQL